MQNKYQKMITFFILIEVSFFVYIHIISTIIIINIEKGRQCKVGETPYQSEDPSPTIIYIALCIYIELYIEAYRVRGWGSDVLQFAPQSSSNLLSYPEDL